MIRHTRPGRTERLLYWMADRLADRRIDRDERRAARADSINHVQRKPRA